MENVTKALLMAFSMMMFVVGFSFSMYMINKVTSTSESVMSTIGTSKYYDSVEVNDISTREVGIETIIPVLYRYYKESYTVDIYDGDTLIQKFDTTIEGEMNSVAKKSSVSGREASLKSAYDLNGTGNKPEAYMFGAPWTGSNEAQKTRIDYFLSGMKGYISGVEVDYGENSPAFKNNVGGFIGKYKETTFIESFVEYVYTGETVSTSEGIETITGSTQEKSKIVITYRVK